MALPPAWATLPSDLLLLVFDRMTPLRSYLAARGVCAGWRSALAPPSPCLLFVLHHGGNARRTVLAVSHPLEHPFHLTKLRGSSSWCFGASGGWLADATFLRDGNEETVYVVLLNTGTDAREEVPLPIMQWDRRLERTWPYVRIKVVFAPNPTRDDFTAVAICGDKTVAYVSAGDETWSIQEIPGDDTELSDVVCTPGDDGDSEFYCLTKTGDVLAVFVPRGGGHGRNEPVILLALIPGGGVPSDPDDAFPPPYARVSEHTSAKYLVFWEGDMYQLWRTDGAVDLQVPGGDPFRMSQNEVFVLRWRGPRWEAVADMGGRSVFVGLNNAVTVRAEGVPGLTGDCVYWASEFDQEAIVFDMRTRTSTPCLAPSLGASCWYV